MDYDVSAIKELRIHPAIGVARVGNAPITDYFVGPEKPGVVPSELQGGGKNAHKEIRRQAARFRVYAYGEGGRLLGEVTASPRVTIAWTVHVVNKKAVSPTTAANKLNGIRRNREVPDAALHGLVINPGARTLARPKESKLFDGGKFTYPGFTPVNVDLGGMETDDKGRLLVIAAAGTSGSPDPQAHVRHYYNNSKWYDDVADGPVTARVTIDGRVFEGEKVVSAWVLSGPPDYAPFIDTPQSLYDHLIAAHWPPAPGQPGNGGRPSYTRDVYPILARAAAVKWVRQSEEPKLLDLRTAHKADKRMRVEIAKAIQNLPGGITRVQQNILGLWAIDHEPSDWKPEWNDRPPREEEITPDGLDRAALEACVGGGFAPGIEVGVWVDDRAHFQSRLRVKGEPGDLTQRMALPWQADFYACNEDNWWPAQRPNLVIVSGHDGKHSWARSIHGMHAMVEAWKSLGFIVPKGQQQVEVGGPPV